MKGRGLRKTISSLVVDARGILAKWWVEEAQWNNMTKALRYPEMLWDVLLKETTALKSSQFLFSRGKKNFFSDFFFLVNWAGDDYVTRFQLLPIRSLLN